MKKFASKVDIEIDGRVAAVRFGKIKLSDEKLFWDENSYQIYSWKDDVDDISGGSASRAYSKDYSDLYETQEQMYRSLVVRVLT